MTHAPRCIHISLGTCDVNALCARVWRRNKHYDHPLLQSLSDGGDSNGLLLLRMGVMACGAFVQLHLHGRRFNAHIAKCARENPRSARVMGNLLFRA